MYTLDYIAMFVTATTIVEYRKDRNEAEIQSISPEQQELFEEFHRIDRGITSVSSIEILRDMASKNYVRSVLGTRAVPDLHTNFGRNFGTPDTSPETPVPRKALFDGKRASITALTNEKSGPTQKKRKKNVDWKKAIGEHFTTLEASETCIDRFQIFNTGGSQKGDYVVGEDRYLIIKTFDCSNRKCKARIYEQPEGKGFCSKVVLDTECACCPRVTQSIPKHWNELIMKFIDNNPTAAPMRITNSVMKELSCEKSWVQNQAAAVKNRLHQKVKRVKGKRRKAGGENGDNPSFLKVDDIVKYRKQYCFLLPIQSSQWKFISTRENLKEIAVSLFDEDKLRVVPSDTIRDQCKLEGARNQPENLLTVLEGSFSDKGDMNLSDSERNLYDHIQKIHDPRKDNGTINDLFEECIVFSSLAMLTTIVDCKKLNFKVTVSADGTYSIARNDWKLLNFGVFTITERGTRQFQPFFFAFCPKESGIFFSIAMVIFLKYARVLFGIIDIPFGGLAVSDHARAFVNTFRIAFPNTKTGSCFTHIIRKFSPGTGNGSYCGKFGQTFVKGTAHGDVHALNRCLTKPMFDCLSEMVYSGWQRHKSLRTCFFKYYIRDPDCSNWFVGASGICQNIPENNPNEGCTLRLKGKQDQNGLLTTTGLDLSVMMHQQFPNAIHTYSLQNTGVKHHFLIDNKEKMMHPQSDVLRQLINFYGMVDPYVDVFQRVGDSFMYINCLENEAAMSDSECGHVISDKRLKHYEDALTGKAHVESEERKKFIHLVDSLCRVSVQTNSDGTRTCRGSCVSFLKGGWCVHAGYVQYKEQLVKKCRVVEQGKPGRIRNHPTRIGRMEATTELSRTLHRILAIRSSVNMLALDTLTYNLPISQEITQILYQLPDIETWTVSLGMDNKRRSVLWLKSKSDTAKLSLRNHHNAHDAMLRYRLDQSDSNEKAVMAILNLLMIDLQIITKGTTTLTTPCPDRTTLDPVLSP